VVLGEINTRLTQNEVEQLGVGISPQLLRGWKRATETVSVVARHESNRATTVALHGLDTVDEFDRLVGQVWSETLALPELEVDVPFSDLGGNSILITQMYKSFEAHHPGVMEMADLFSLTTVREQATHLRQTLQKKTSTDIDTVLARLAHGELTIEDAERFI